MSMDPPVPEPYRIKAVEPIHLIPREEREERLREAGFNLFNLRSDDVYVDLLTDSGVGAMSDRQWAGFMMGDESYAGSRNHRHLVEAVRDVLGFRYVLPCHQGRGTENVVARAMIQPGKIVTGNTPFDTTRAHIEDKGGRVVDCIVPEAHATHEVHPFKGDVDVQRLDEVLTAEGADVAYVLVTVTCNTAGGQPVSLANLQATRKVTEAHGVPLFLDIARYAENAWFIKAREDGQADRPVAAIARDMMAVADLVLMSGKKNALVNMGGFLATNDPQIRDQLVPYVVLHEGFVTYGGLSGRDLEAMAVGLREGIGEAHLQHRVGQVRYLHDRLSAAGVPLLNPAGGHAVFLDALAFLPEVPREELPGQALAIELYREGAVRTVEIGTVLRGRDPATHENVFPEQELVRLALPPRMYTRDHLDWVAATVERVWERRNDVRGVVFDEEAPVLRHFTSTFKPAGP